MALARCCLVCTALYHSARRILMRTALTVDNREVLHAYARIFLSKRNRPFGSVIRQLKLSDDPHKPFAHVWPMLIPGSVLPRVESLHLIGVDWAAMRPNGMFFDRYLGYYTGIKQLHINRCRFRSAAELRRLIKALPNLEFVQVLSITVKHAPVPPSLDSRSMIETRDKLKTISLFGDLTMPRDIGGARRIALRQSVLNMCAAFSSVVDLRLYLRYFSSFAHLESFLCHFPSLDALQLSGSFEPHAGPLSDDVFASLIHVVRPSHPSLSSFGLLLVPVTCAEQVLQLVSTSQACSKLDGMSLRLTGTPSAELVQDTAHTLRMCGSRFEYFTWECDDHTGE